MRFTITSPLRELPPPTFSTPSLASLWKNHPDGIFVMPTWPRRTQWYWMVPEEMKNPMNPDDFICPECGSREANEFVCVETLPSETDPWSAILQRCKCAKCGNIIPAHLAERWDGLSQEQAVREWKQVYRTTASKHCLG